MANEQRGRGVVVVIGIVVLIAVVAAVLLCVPRGDAKRKAATEAVVTSGAWEGERRAGFFGRGLNGSRTWHGEDSGVRMTRVMRAADPGTGQETVSVLVSELGKWEVEFRGKWVGDGEYDAERTDLVTKVKTPVKVRITVPVTAD